MAKINKTILGSYYSSIVNERSRAVKQELVAAVWHPCRVEKLVESYGLDILEVL